MLKDKLFQQKLDEDGYLLIDFFDQAEVDQLESAFEELHNFDIGKEMFFSNLYRNTDYQDKARITIRKFLSPKVDQFFDNADWLEGVFVIKPSGCGDFSNHQDWTMIDETKYRSYGIWCPLLDVDESNGTFCILKGSHRFYSNYRSCTIPWCYNTDEMNRIIDKNKTTLNVKKGQAIIFDHAIIHSTTPNQTEKRRGVIFLGLKPKSSPIYHYYYDKEQNTIEGFEVDGDFFYHYDYVTRPNGYKSLGFVKDPVPNITASLLKRKIWNSNWKQLNFVKRLRYRNHGIHA